MKSNMVKIGLIFLVVILFIFLTVMPMVFSINSEFNDGCRELEKLAFICREPNGFNNIKYEYYKQQLSKQSSSERNYSGDMIKNENTIIRIKTQPVPLSLGPTGGAWPMKCHDTSHTSRSPYSTMDTSAEKWRFYFTGWLDDSPSIGSDGTIYCKGAYNYLDRYIYAINPDGTEKWKYKTDDLIFGSSPAIAEDGTIYFGSWDDYLYALHQNGTRKWRFLSYGDIYSSPAIAEDGTIYFGVMGPSDYGRVYAVNPNGTEKWHYDTDHWITSDPAIGDDGTIYIGSQDDYFYALWPNGTLRWRYKTGDYIMGPPSIAEDGNVYIASWDGYLYAFYPNNGTMKWRHPIGVGAAINPSIANDGTIYIGYNDLYAVYPNGTRRWTFDLGAQRHIQGSSPIVSADGIIYVGVEIGENKGGEIIAINSDGTENWRKRIAGEWVKSSPSIGEDGTVYIGSAYTIARAGIYMHLELPKTINHQLLQPLQAQQMEMQGQHMITHSYQQTLKIITLNIMLTGAMEQTAAGVGSTTLVKK